jgi:hypothetical protein
MYGVLFWVNVAVAFTTIKKIYYSVFHTEKLSQLIPIISNISKSLGVCLCRGLMVQLAYSVTIYLKRM